jgi:hypothetical protein
VKVNRMTLRSLLSVALLPLAACATGGGQATPAGDEVIVEVQNNFRPMRDATVRIISPTGARQLLGSASPGGSTVLRYRGNIVSGDYRLQASRRDGDEVTSEPFVLFPGAHVVWSLPQNSIAVYPPEVEGGRRTEGAGRFRGPDA